MYMDGCIDTPHSIPIGLTCKQGINVRISTNIIHGKLLLKLIVAHSLTFLRPAVSCLTVCSNYSIHSTIMRLTQYFYTFIVIT